MQWTTEKPTKAGWYWFRKQITSIVYVDEHGEVDFAGDERTFCLECPGWLRQEEFEDIYARVFAGGEWAGPLQVPT